MAGRKGEKEWAHAMRRAVMRRIEGIEGKPQKLERLADKVVELGLAGDMQALKEIGDRLDGKSVQQKEIGGPDGGDIPIKMKITKVVVDPADED